MPMRPCETIEEAVDEKLYGYAIELCRPYLEEFPDDARIWVLYGKSLAKFSRYQDSEMAYARANQLAEGLNGVILTALGRSYENRGDYESAEHYFFRAIEAEPSETFPRIFLARTTFRRGDLSLAEQRYREAIGIGGSEVDEAYGNLGGVLVAQERYQEAIECYEEALKIDPDYEWVKLRLEDVEKAMACAQVHPQRRWLSNRKPKRRTLQKARRTRYQKGREIDNALYKDRIVTALELCKVHLSVYPRAGTSWIRYGRALVELARYDEAEYAFQMALELSHSSFYALIADYQATASEKRGKYDDAERHLLTAVEHEPDEAYYRTSLGFFAFRRGDLGAAERRHQEALVREQDRESEAGSYEDLGFIRLAQERYEEAAECYRRAIELDPNEEMYKRGLRDAESALLTRL